MPFEVDRIVGDERSPLRRLDWQPEGCLPDCMQVERIAPILTVRDVAAAVAEHASVLGMRVVMDMGWIAFLADDAGRQIGLMTSDATAPVNPDVSVFVDDVEAAYAAANAAGVEIVHPLSYEDWGVRRFFYRDSSGRVINVGTHALRLE